MSMAQCWSTCQTIPTVRLISRRRYDLAVKWRLFRHFITGADPDSIRVYQWHIEARKSTNAKVNVGMDSNKRDLGIYVRAAADLCESMTRIGFVPSYAIPIDPDIELLGGAHRTACALALGIDDVPVVSMPQRVWAPPWDLQWFIDNGMNDSDLERLKSDFEGMYDRGHG